MNFDSCTNFLLIDDDEIFRTRLAHAIKDRGFEVSDVACPIQGVQIATKMRPTHVILDLRMPKKSGLETLKEILQTSQNSKVLILTGYGSIVTALDAIRNGAVNYLSKPADLEQILHAFSGQINSRKTQKEVPSLNMIEWDHIQRVMLDCKGNISHAAKMLGLHRRSLQRKLNNPPKC